MLSLTLVPAFPAHSAHDTLVSVTWQVCAHDFDPATTSACCPIWQIRHPTLLVVVINALLAR